MKRLGPAPPLGNAPSSDASARLLVVGRDIVITGEIQSCDCLVVEGTVKANVTCNELRIAHGGLVLGSAAVADADVAGRFEGELHVSQRLLLRASGKIAAKLRYHQIVIELGGQISGDVQSLDASQPVPVPTASVRNRM
jgi:cytoskeletal protein CcmA (bactofilin family)